MNKRISHEMGEGERRLRASMLVNSISMNDLERLWGLSPSATYRRIRHPEILKTTEMYAYIETASLTAHEAVELLRAIASSNR